MANEGKIKLKVKVDASELVKVKGALQDIHNAELEGSKSGEGAVEKKKKTKIATEELTKSQQFAAEMAKTLGEEQNQLATNVDAAEVAQKALGAALQSYVGITPVAIGATLAVASAVNYGIESALRYNEELRMRGRELALLGITEKEYQAIVKQGSELDTLRTSRLASLGQGFVLTAEQTRMTAATITMFSDVLGGAANAQNLMQQSLAGSTDAMRSFGFTAAEGSTKEQAFRGFLAHISALEKTDHEARVRIRSEVNARALSTDSERYKQIMIDGEYRQYSANQNRILQESIRAAQERYRVQADLQTQFLETQKQREVRAALDAARESAAAAMGRTTRLQDVSGVELGNRLTEAWQHVADVNSTVARTDEQRVARANAQIAANQRVAALNEEINRRANTAEGVRERLRAQAIQRGLAAGMTTQQLERISITNGQVRIQLEARIAELRARLRDLSGQDAENIRNQIAGILGQLQSVSGTSQTIISLKEIKDLVLQIRRAVAETNQSDFIRGIEQGTLSIEDQMRRVNELRVQRDQADSAHRQALVYAQEVAKQLEDAESARERQRITRIARRAQEDVTRTQENLRTITSSYDAAGQAISRSIREREEKANQERINEEKLAYDRRARNLQNQSRETQDYLSRDRQLFDAFIASQEGSASIFQESIADLFSPERMMEHINQGIRDAAAVTIAEKNRLDQMRASGLASPEELDAQSQRVVDARRNEAIATNEATQAITELQQRMADSSFGGQFAKAMTNNAKGLASLGNYAGGLAAKGLTTFSDAIWTSLEAIKSGEDVGAALNKMLTATLQSIGQEATVRALMETAAGFAALATPVTAPTAAGHFAAAGVYASVAALAGVGYMTLPTPPEKSDREKKDTEKEREMINAKQAGNTVVFNSAAFAATKEELAKIGRHILSRGIDL